MILSAHALALETVHHLEHVGAVTSADDLLVGEIHAVERLACRIAPDDLSADSDVLTHEASHPGFLSFEWQFLTSAR